MKAKYTLQFTPYRVNGVMRLLTNPKPSSGKAGTLRTSWNESENGKFTRERKTDCRVNCFLPASTMVTENHDLLRKKSLNWLPLLRIFYWANHLSDKLQVTCTATWQAIQKPVQNLAKRRSRPHLVSCWTLTPLSIPVIQHGDGVSCE